MTRASLLAAAGALALAATPAAAQTARASVSPYIELNQTVAVDLKGGDAVTYTAAAAGVDASIDTARAAAQVSARYEHRFSYEDGIGDDDVLSGLARGQVRVGRTLTLEGGALATRTRSDIRGDAPGVLTNGVGNTSQLYSLFAGPTLATRAGPVTLDAAYRIGYTKVETPSANRVAPGQPRFDYYDDSLGQIATIGAAVAPRAVLPFGLSASAGYEREDAGQLDGLYEDVFARGDVLLPVSPTLALTAGVGYEKLTTSQRDPVLTGLGVPVVDDNGRFVTDDASPRRVTYRTDGVYYDAGVVWRPNRRTSVEAHVGHRYGDTTYTGTATYQASKTVGVAVGVYDTVTTFGRQLRTGVANLPTSFIATRDQFAQAFNGCTFGTTGAAPGGCLDSVFQSVTTSSYRARGIDAVVSATRGRSTFGAGAGYANRKLFTPDVAAGVQIYGLEDESWYGQLFFNRRLTAVSGFDAQAFLDYYKPGQRGSDDVVSAGATASYYHYFGRLGTTASVGLYSFRVGDGIDTQLSGQAQLGAQYRF